MSIHTGRIRGFRSSFADGAGHDLRDAARAVSPPYHGSPDAVARFREILEQQRLGREAVAEKEIEPVTQDFQVEVVDDRASRAFHEARTNLTDPSPVVIKLDRKRRRLSDTEAREAHVEYQAGESVRGLAERWGVNAETLTRRWRSMGLTAPARGGQPRGAKKTAVVVAAPAAPAAPVVEVGVVETAVSGVAIPHDLAAQIRAFQADMAALGVETEVSVRLKITKEVVL